MKASLKNARISPKKMNLVAGLIRGKKAQEALDQLKFTPKKGAELLYKVLHSAVANATNNFKQKKENLVIKSILVTKGMTYKRGIPVSRGRYHPILKRNSHVVVEVGIEDTPASEAKEAPKAKAKKEATVKKEAPKKEVAPMKTAPKETATKKETPKKTTETKEEPKVKENN